MSSGAQRARRAKRALDVAVAAPLLAVAALPMLAIAIAIRASMGTPVVFRHRRIGEGGRSFTLLKFRTMRDGAPGEADELRLTAVGRVLRALSLDELPQLWNVLRGEMSLVGPRPLLPQYLERYTSEQARRHEVLPGITGLAQVRGRNALGWEEKFALDVWYVEHQSLQLDLRILGETIGAVLFRRDISAAGHATMPEFMGSGASIVRGESREDGRCATW
jgi:lipopolysaccharide/colanic/teichoic acid biosynthesis glycosyltransferase